MKKIAFLVFVLAAAVIAEEEAIKRMANIYETDVETIEKCMNEAGTDIEKIRALKNRLKNANSDSIDEETKKDITEHGKFIACMLEEKEMMKDSKLIVDKVFETMIKEKPNLNQDGLKTCLVAINKDEEMNRESTALKLMMCITDNKSADDDDDDDI